uniref:Uncharacterized protein n=1 Tax=Panagrolaimus davidi TaxID=227884 RepID=A0A914NXV6_9BILA
MFVKKTISGACAALIQLFLDLIQYLILPKVYSFSQVLDVLDTEIAKNQQLLEKTTILEYDNNSYSRIPENGQLPLTGIAKIIPVNGGGSIPCENKMKE